MCLLLSAVICSPLHRLSDRVRTESCMANNEGQDYSCVVIPHKPGLVGLTTEDLLVRRRCLAATAGDLELVLLGSVVAQTRRCGKATCRCVTGTPHGPYLYLCQRRNGSSGMRYVPAALAESVRLFLQQGERAELTLAEISAINVELLARRHLG